MEINDILFTQLNTTILFKSLDNDSIRVDFIRKSSQEQETLLNALRGMLVVNFPQRGIHANYSNNRLFVTYPIKELEVDKQVGILASTSLALVKAIPEYGSKIVAYGFNVDGKCSTNKTDISKYFLEVYHEGGHQLAELIGTNIIWVAPRFGFEKYGALFGISFVPSEEEKDSFLFQCNIHFANDHLPEEVDFSQQFVEYIGYFQDILRIL